MEVRTANPEKKTSGRVVMGAMKTPEVMVGVATEMTIPCALATKAWIWVTSTMIIKAHRSQYLILITMAYQIVVKRMGGIMVRGTSEAVFAM